MIASNAVLFRALGDESRLAIIQRLIQRGRCRIGSFGDGLAITRQAIRKHLHVLEEAQIVTLEPSGRDVYVQLNPEAIQSGRAYLEQVEARWDQKLNALKEYLENEPDASA